MFSAIKDDIHQLEIDLDTELAMLDRQFQDNQFSWIMDFLLTNLNGGFDCLVDCYRRYVYGVIRCFLGWEDVDDIVQEAFIRAYLALKEYPLERVRTLKVRPWLRVIAKNTALNYRAYRARHQALSLELFQEAGGQLIGGKQNEAENLLVRLEIVKEINSWLKELEIDDRQILLEHFSRGLDYSSIQVVILHGLPYHMFVSIEHCCAELT